MFVLLCLLSGLLIGVVGVSYKLVSTCKCDSDRFRLILVWGGAVLAALGVVLGKEVLSNRVVLVGGAAAGLCFFIGLIAIMQAMASGPVSFTWMLANLAIGIPILLSAAIWSEPIRHLQWLGLAFFVASLTLFGKDLQRSGSKDMTLKWALAAVVMFLTNGAVLFCFRAISKYTSVPHTFSTLLIDYVVSGVFLLGYSWRRLARPSVGDIKLGLFAAGGMMGGHALIIKTLAINTASSLPIIHSSSIIAVAVASAIMFGERLSKYSGGGLLCGLVSIVLLTVG